jgi:hypothetical protein
MQNLLILLEATSSIMTIHVIEIVAIAFIIVIQINISFRLANKIERLKDLNLHDTKFIEISYPVDAVLEYEYNSFDELLQEEYRKTNSKDEIEPKELDDNLIRSTLLYTDKKNSDANRIIEDVNTYIIKNDQHLINFNVIRDIVDRNYQVMDDDINQMLPTPLYLGLAATMLGIIFGLFGMMIGEHQVDIVNSVDSLILGVGIAMSSSLIGLALTTVFSTLIYKNSKREAEEEKNAFYSQLQANLLPEILRRGETGIEALNKNLERFGRVASNSVEKLTGLTRTSAENIALQVQLIDKVDKLNVSRLSSASIKIFENLERNLASFEKFTAYWDNLNNTLGATSTLISNLQELTARFESVEEVGNRIRSTLEDYNKAMAFFSKHVEQLEAGGEKAMKAVTMADVAFEEAIEVLKIHINKHLSGLNADGNKLDVRLNEIGSEVASSLHKATSEHLSRLHETYNNHIPEFNKLNLLDNLLVINETISSSQNNTVEINANLIQELIKSSRNNEKAIRQLNNSLKTAPNGTQSMPVGEGPEIEPPTGKKFILWQKVETVLRISSYVILISAGIAFLSILFTRIFWQ